MENLITDFLDRGIIMVSDHEEGEFISNVFLREKKDGSFRMILNLKELNQFIPYNHFKMDNINSCVRLMKPSCYMASIDLKDAYFSMPVHHDYQKYLKFVWQGVLYKFTCMPQGLACAPRLFTKLLKPVYAYLRSKRHVVSGYLDDSFLEGDTFSRCADNVTTTVNLFDSLGFSPHLEKSITTPSQIIEHLGFLLNSIDMTVSIIKRKLVKLQALAATVTNNDFPTIREVACLIGFMVSCIPGVEFAELFYIQLEVEKSEALKKARGNFEAVMKLSDIALGDIQWWLSNAILSKRHINHGPIDLELATDASKQGWGASLDNLVTGGRWSLSESLLHINVLELKAVLLGLQSLCKEKKDCHIKILSDNTTAVSYLKKMGGTHSPQCNNIAREIWMWCISKGIWLTPAHIPGVDNVEADLASRVFNDKTEWQLDKSIFAHLVSIFGKPDIDMFASRLNYQIKPFVSWAPDPEAVAADAFTLNWDNKFMYIFPPFSIIPRILQKIEADRARALMIVPLWATQSWFPKLTRMLIQEPALLPQIPQLLTLPFQRETVHPLQGKLQLMGCLLSGQDSQGEAFRQELKKSCSNHGERGPKNNTKCTYKDGYPFVVDDIPIPCNQL
jgi:hypothetical protein